MDPTRNKLASPTASPTGSGDKSSVRHVLKAFNAIDVGKPSKRNISFDITPTKNSEIENTSENTDHLSLGLTANHPAIVTTVHDQDIAQNDSLCGLLDNLQKLSVTTPSRKDDTNHLSVERIVDSHASSDDEAFLECNSFVDESMLLQATLHAGSRDDLHSFLNETELLNPPPSGTPDVRNSHKIVLHNDGGWSLATAPSSISEVSAKANLAMALFPIQSLDGNGNSAEDGASSIDSGGSAQCAGINHEESAPRSTVEINDNLLLASAESTHEDVEEINDADDVQSLDRTVTENEMGVVNAYDSEDVLPIVLITNDPIQPEPETETPTDIENTNQTLPFGDGNLQQTPILCSPLEVETIRDPPQPMHNLPVDTTLPINEQLEQTDNLNETVDMADEVWTNQTCSSTAAKPTVTAMYVSQDEAMDVDFDEDIESFDIPKTIDIPKSIVTSDQNIVNLNYTIDHFPHTPIANASMLLGNHESPAVGPNATFVNSPLSNATMLFRNNESPIVGPNATFVNSPLSDATMLLGSHESPVSGPDSTMFGKNVTFNSAIFDVTESQLSVGANRAFCDSNKASGLSQNSVNDSVNSPIAPIVVGPNETFVGGNITFKKDYTYLANDFMDQQGVDSDSELCVLNIESETFDLRNVTVNMGDALEIPSQIDDVAYKKTNDTNTTVVIDNSVTARRNSGLSPQPTYSLFAKETQSNVINYELQHGDDEPVVTAQNSKRTSLLSRSSTINAEAQPQQDTDHTLDIGDNTLTTSSDTSEPTNETVRHQATQQVTHEDGLFAITNAGNNLEGPSQANQFDPNNDLFKMPAVPKMFKEVETSSISAASSTLSLNDQFEDAVSARPMQSSNSLGMRDDEFHSSAMVFQSSDFDFLLAQGSNVETVPDRRDSLLLRFDPLLGRSILVNQTAASANDTAIPIAGLSIKEEPSDESFASAGSTSMHENNSPDDQQYCLNSTLPLNEAACQNQSGQPVFNQLPSGVATSSRASSAANATMSVGLIQDIKTDCDVKPFAVKMEHNSHSGLATLELERKIEVELLKSEDAEKKLKEAEQREESLLRRITEKDKAIAKMNGLMEQYEKAIAELVAEKEAAISTYEGKNAELKADRDSNFQHLSSLENTFSDLHAKYERSKQMTAQLKDSEDALKAEVEKTQETLRQQEQRYEKMKNHAIQQLDIANNKLEVLTRNNTMETAKLKAHLKKEEISRQAAFEQLTQKIKENEELMKICDELINGQSS